MSNKNIKDCNNWDKVAGVKLEKRRHKKARRVLTEVLKKKRKAKSPCTAKKIQKYLEKKLNQSDIDDFSDKITSVDFKKKMPF